METIPCPGCTTALEPSATECPICLRPRGRLEITRAYATLRLMEKQRRQRPFILAGYLVAAGAAAWVVYRYHAPILAAGFSARARAGQAVNGWLDSAVPQAPTPVAPPSPSQPAASPSTPAPIASGLPPAPPLSPPPSAPTRPAAPARVDDLAIPPLNSSMQWAFYGRAYDLISLRPVANAQLTFQLAGSYGGVAAQTDEYGRFIVVLSRQSEGSFEIRASHPQYASAVLYESDIPYARLPLTTRLDMVRSAQDGDMALPPLTDVAGEESIRRDIFLAPRR